MARTLQAHYPHARVPQLTDYLTDPPPTGRQKCRIRYSDRILSIDYTPYHPRKISTLTIVESAIDYHYKYANRSALDRLKADVPTDDILIVQRGYLTDTSYSNLAFFDGEQWITPHTPLLKGTMRERLLQEGEIVEQAVTLKDLPHFHHIALTNAMIGFEVLHGVTLYERGVAIANFK